MLDISYKMWYNVIKLRVGNLMKFDTNADKGRAGLSMAIAYFGTNGYTVSLPLNDTQWYDLIVEKDGVFQTVQCKATGTSNGKICLRSCGGTQGKEYDNILNHPVDILFCVDNSLNMFLIPMKDLRNYSNSKSINLRTKRAMSENKNSFPTYNYLVRLD